MSASTSGFFARGKSAGPKRRAAGELAPEHEAQLINYMRITRYPIGYLINFGPIGRLQWKRFILSEFLDNLECERTANER